jgi:hypothetical protein
MRSIFLAGLSILFSVSAALADQPDGDAAVDFDRDVRPLLKNKCSRCHSGHKHEGGLSMNTRRDLLAGGDDGPAIVLGDAAKSNLIARVTESDPEVRMPQGSEPLTADQIAVLKKWIEADAQWPDDYNLAEWRQAPLAPRQVELPAAADGISHPIDRLLAPYHKQHAVTRSESVADGVFARRVWLDLAGLLPPADELERFVADASPAKREQLVDRLLDDREAYAEHWLTFWSDMLRNAYRGTGFIDGGRKTITQWLYTSLYDNKPYDQFCRELISPVPGSEGFIKGIKWRGTVNASQRQEMQAAQNVAQIFLGTNLKCASCHDSFVNHWRLTDSYNLAAVFADGPLELHRCDKPAGKQAEPQFIYAELGKIDAAAAKPERMKQLAAIATSAENGRFARTMVNRLWAHLFGRGIVEPVDDMEQQPFSADLLDWLAADFAAHQYDLKHTLRMICTSRTYQMPAVGADGSDATKRGQFVFRGPLIRRMSAEQFIDSISALTGTDAGQREADLPKPATSEKTLVRSVLTNDDPLNRALGRPNREQVVTQRESVATTLQALELTNGEILANKLKRGATNLIGQSAGDAEQVVQRLYLAAFGRKPTEEERTVALELIGSPIDSAGVEDLLWIVAMLPEFQLIR